MKPDYKLVAKAKYVYLTAEMASEIYRECHKKLFQKKQMDFLIEATQSSDAIEEAMDNNVNYVLVILGGKPVGYFAWKMVGTALHLNHIYLKEEMRGRALGRGVLQYCERLARSDGKNRILCRVNVKSLRALAFFKRMGYKPNAEVETEIGEYILNEFELEKRL